MICSSCTWRCFLVCCHLRCLCQCCRSNIYWIIYFPFRINTNGINLTCVVFSTTENGMELHHRRPGYLEMNLWTWFCACVCVCSVHTYKIKLIVNQHVFRHILSRVLTGFHAFLTTEVTLIMPAQVQVSAENINFSLQLWIKITRTDFDLNSCVTNMDVTNMIYGTKRRFSYKSLQPEFKVTWVEVAVCVKGTSDGGFFFIFLLDSFVQKLF